MTPFFIGITGGSGSGKTALARELKKHFGGKPKFCTWINIKGLVRNCLDFFGRVGDCPAAISGLKSQKDFILRKIRGLLSLKDISFFYKLKVCLVLTAFSLRLARNSRPERKNLKNEKYIKKILLPKYI